MGYFLLSFFLFYALLHLYAFLKARAALAFSGRAAAGLAFFMLLMTIAPLMVRLAEQQGFDGLARLMAFVGYSWLGFTFLFVSAALPIDVCRLTVYAAGAIRRRDLTMVWLTARPAFLLPLGIALVIGVYGYFEALLSGPKD